MRAGVFWGLTALLLAISSRAAEVRVDRHSSLAPADWALRGAEADVADFALSPADAAKRDEVMCRPDESIDKVMAAFNDGPLPSWAEPETDRVILAVVAYYRCRAFVARDRALCEPLKAFHLKRDDPPALSAAPVELKPHSRALGCVGRMNEMALVRAYIAGGPEFEKLCEPSLSAVQKFEESEFADADVKKVCAVLSKRLPPRETCAKLKPLYLTPEKAAGCVATLDRLHGDDCEGPQTIEKAESCRSYVAYRKARAANDVSLCGGLPVCEVLMGKGAESCRPYADTFKSLFCAPPAARLGRLEAELKQADDALAGFADSGEAALPGLRARRADLQTKYEKIKRDIGGGTPAAAE